MKKILMLLTNAFLPDPRPHREAVSLTNAGYKVKILCWDRGENLPKYEVVDRIEIDRIRVRSTHGRGTLQAFILPIVWFKMLCHIAKEDFDVMWCHDFDSLPAGLVVKALRRKAVIFDSHEVYSTMLSGAIPRPLEMFVGFLEKMLIKRSDHVIVVSPEVAKVYLPLGVINITVIGNFKDPDMFHIAGEVIEKEKQGLGIKNELVICYIANLGAERVIEPLLESVKEDEDLFLIVGGTGHKQALVERCAKECPRIRYLGYVAPNKVPLYTALSDIVYGFDRHAAQAEYCNPNKLFEALAAGKAFIGGDFGEMGDIVKEERCGIALRDFNKESVKKAIELMKDNDKLRAFKENSKKAGIEKYNWKVSEKALLKIIADIK